MIRLQAKAVLLDIEGTIASQSFVMTVLFGYPKAHLRAYVARNRGNAAVEAILADAAQLSGSDPVEALADWQERDQKVPPLKKLQGMIWEGGYRDGAYKAHLFPDALAALQRWHRDGLPLYIYSSGSVHAQLLYMQYSEAGDVRGLFSGHFDTGSGGKTEAASYAAIAQGTGFAPGDIVFFSDNPKELSAATAAGLQAVHVVKEGTPPAPGFAAIGDFGQVAIVRG